MDFLKNTPKLNDCKKMFEVKICPKKYSTALFGTEHKYKTSYVSKVKFDRLKNYVFRCRFYAIGFRLNEITALKFVNQMNNEFEGGRGEESDIKQQEI